ncbi:hypothetical protein AAF712_004184 [Marasmius tenuissimus]|uniref:Proteophosphoglycan ppg4 n=1 Tax=Marasmius tenuissimus TaxID=585030 RepID=A0ABR3A773_9AGAR|nr:hypothetical protein PM082_001733 [Marasmius tenuissimus]
MLIRLLPPPTQPTVLFKLTFENLPEAIQIPTAWSNQLAALAIDDLEVPNLLHAFDKSAGIQCIVEEVTFDLVERTVRCLFVDGEVEQWEMNEEAERECGCPQTGYKGNFGCGVCRRRPTLTERLESVLDDVSGSAKETERERKAAQEINRAAEKGERVNGSNGDHDGSPDAKPLTLNSPPGTLKGNHKKQRSLLMNLVASLLPTSTPEVAGRSRPPKRANSLPSTRAPSPSDRSPPGDSQTSETSAGWSSWTTLARTMSNPIGRKPSSGKRRKLKSKSISESPVLTRPDNSAEFVESPTSYSSPSSPVSTAPPSPSLQPVRTRPVSTCSLPPGFVCPPVIIAPPPVPKLTARALRRRARSTLVDTFRLCVLPELQNRVRVSPTPGVQPSGWETTIIAATTYYSWYMNSMIKRVEKRLAEIVDEAAECLTHAEAQSDLNEADQSWRRKVSIDDCSDLVPSHEEDSVSAASTSVFMTATEEGTLTTTTATTLYESFDDPSYDSDGTSDTDSTFPHTPGPSSPVISGEQGYFLPKSEELQPVDEAGSPSNASPAEAQPTPSDVLGHLPSFPSIDSSTLSGSLRQVITQLDTTYTALVALHSHLAGLVASAREREKEAIDDVYARDELLEVRCRRRAWLGKGWGLPRSTGELATSTSTQFSSSASWKTSPQAASGLAAPFRPSGLGQHTWSGDEWEYDPWYCYSDYCSTADGHGHEIYQSFSRSRLDSFDDDEEDIFSQTGTSTSSLHSGYAYQYSGRPYDDTDTAFATPRELMRRSLDEGMTPLADETFPEPLLPHSRFPSPAALEQQQQQMGSDLGTRRPPKDQLNVISERRHSAGDAMVLSTQPLTDPFEDPEAEVPRPRRKSSGAVLASPPPPPPPPPQDVFEEFFEWAHPQTREGDADLEGSGSAGDDDKPRSSVFSPVAGAKHKGHSRRSSSMSESKLFFPVSEDDEREEEEAEENLIEDGFTFDVSGLGINSPPPELVRPRVRTESFKLQCPPDLGLGLGRRASVPGEPVSPTSPTFSTFPSSPSSPTSYHSTPLVQMSVSLLPVPSDSANFELELVVGHPYPTHSKKNSQGWLSKEGGVENSHPVGIIA